MLLSSCGSVPSTLLPRNLTIGGPLEDTVKFNFSPCRTRPLREVVESPTNHRRQSSRCCWSDTVDIPLELTLVLLKDEEAFAVEVPIVPLLLLPPIRRRFVDSGGEGVTFLLPALPTELLEVDGFDDVDADAEETDDAPNTKPPLLPSALLGLSSDFHCPVNNNSAAASTFKPDRRRQADKSRSEY